MSPPAQATGTDLRPLISDLWSATIFARNARTLSPPTPAGPLSGTKTIDNTQPTAGNNYISFTAAINDLNTNGVGSGGVTFNVTAGQTFSELAPFINATGTSANQIIFQRSGAGANPIVQGTNGIFSGSSIAGDACISIDGGSYITFDGIDAKDNPANANNTTKMEFCYRPRRGAQNSTIKNTTITLNRTYTASIHILHTATSTISGDTAGGSAKDT